MKAELFLGFPLTESLNNKLDKTDPRLIDMFVNANGPYLKLVVHEECTFLGKEIGQSTDLVKIKLLEANIYSILSKLLPEYPFKNNPLFLFTMILID